MRPDRWLGDARLALSPDAGDGERMRVLAGSAALRRAPDAGAEQINQMLFGEPVRLYARQGEWGYVQLGLDRYVGWTRLSGLMPAGAEPTHRVRVLRTFLYERADMKSRPVRALSMNARIAVTDMSGPYAAAEGGGWVFASHLCPLEESETDFVAIAGRFLGAPYLWGGRQSAGIDCSGLVQIALQATGVFPLRDSDMQEDTLGQPHAFGRDLDDLERGDLVFWKGHVGIMCSPDILLHASARDMHVETEPLMRAVERIRPVAGEVRSVRRFG